MNDHSCFETSVASPKNTKDEIRRQALRLFAERGYSAISMRELAEAVGVRQGALYNHFSGKQALLVDLMASHMETLLATLDPALEGASDPVARLKAFARNHVLHHLDHPDDVFLAYMEIRSLEPENRDQIVTLRDRYEGVLRSILEAGRDEGLFQIADASVHARMLLSMMTGATVWYRDGGRLSRDAVVDCYLQGAVQSLGVRMETS